MNDDDLRNLAFAAGGMIIGGGITLGLYAFVTPTGPDVGIYLDNDFNMAASIGRTVPEDCVYVHERVNAALTQYFEGKNMSGAALEPFLIDPEQCQQQLDAPAPEVF